MTDASRLSYNSPIFDYLLKDNENLVLMVANTDVRGSGRVRAWFFKVRGRAPFHLQYDSELPVIPAGTATEFGIITKGVFNGSEADDLLAISKDSPFVARHFAVGIGPADIWLYRQYNGTPQQTAEFDLTLNPLNTPVPKHSFVDGYMSPYDNPKAVSQDIITAGIKIRYSLYNDAVADLSPTLRFLGCLYFLEAITDNELQQKILTGKVPARFEPVGWFTPFTFTPPAEWPEALTVNLTTMEVE